MPLKNTDRQLINVKYSKYESLTDKKKEQFDVCKPYKILAEYNPNNFIFHENLNLPYSDAYAEQFQNIDNLFNLKSTMIKVASKLRDDVGSYRNLDPEKGFQISFPKIYVAPILGIDNQDIIEHIKTNHTKYEKLLLNDLQMYGAYRRNIFKTELQSWQEQELRKRINNSDYHDIFSYFLRLINKDTIRWTEEPFFQIIALNEYLNEKNANNLNLYEYSQKNFEKLYDKLMSYDYTSYSYTKRLMKALSKNSQIPLLIHTPKTPKQDRDFINNLNQKQIFKLIDNFDVLTSPNLSVYVTIKNMLEEDLDNNNTISYYDTSRFLISMVTESILSNKYESHKKMFIHLASANKILLSTINQFATELSKSTRNKVHYHRIANIVQKIKPYTNEMNAFQLTGFLFSFHSHYRKLAVSDANTEQYIQLLEKTLQEKSPLAATRFFSMLGDLVINSYPTPTLKEWEDYLDSEDEFSMPYSMIMNIITEEEGVVSRLYISSDLNRIIYVFEEIDE